MTIDQHRQLDAALQAAGASITWDDRRGVYVQQRERTNRRTGLPEWVDVDTYPNVAAIAAAFGILDT